MSCSDDGSPEQQQQQQPSTDSEEVVEDADELQDQSGGSDLSSLNVPCMPKTGLQHLKGT